MPSVIVNARFLTQPTTGVQRFAIELSKQLKNRLPDVGFVAPRNIIHSKEAQYLQVETYGKLKSHLWEQIELPFYLKKYDKPLLVNFANTAPIWYTNQVITIHDLSFMIRPEWFSKFFSAFYSYIIPKAARNSRKIITVSHNSKQDIIHMLDVPGTKVEVIYNSVSESFFSDQKLASVNKYSNYILAVSSLDPRKNFRNLILAFNKVFGRLPGIKLVIVGSKNMVFASNDLEELIQQNNSVVFTGYVSDVELASLYKNALLFIYPSFYEGFGIPPLEAMAHGCPTIVSNTSSLPEVCGNASYYVNPYDINDIAKGISTLIENNTIRDALTLKGYERIKLYNWKKSGRQLLQLIESMA